MDTLEVVPVCSGGRQEMDWFVNVVGNGHTVNVQLNARDWKERNLSRGDCSEIFGGNLVNIHILVEHLELICVLDTLYLDGL